MKYIKLFEDFKNSDVDGTIEEYVIQGLNFLNKKYGTSLKISDFDYLRSSAVDKRVYTYHVSNDSAFDEIENLQNSEDWYGGIYGGREYSNEYDKLQIEVVTIVNTNELIYVDFWKYKSKKNGGIATQHFIRYKK